MRLLGEAAHHLLIEMLIVPRIPKHAKEPAVVVARTKLAFCPHLLRDQGQQREHGDHRWRPGAAIAPPCSQAPPVLLKDRGARVHAERRAHRVHQRRLCIITLVPRGASDALQRILLEVEVDGTSGTPSREELLHDRRVPAVVADPVGSCRRTHHTVSMSHTIWMLARKASPTTSRCSTRCDAARFASAEVMRNTLRYRCWLLVLPHAYYTPAGVGERSVHRPIPRDVPLQLRAPVVAVRPRHVPVLRAAVPEASIDEYGQPRAGEDDIGSDDPIRESQRKVLAEA